MNSGWQRYKQFAAIGERHPDIVNMRAVITKLAQATPGVNAEDILLPPPPPTPPVPPIKMTISVSVKWTDLPADVQAKILQGEGMPTELTHLEGAAKLLEKVKGAADNASALEEPVIHDGSNNKRNFQTVQS